MFFLKKGHLQQIMQKVFFIVYVYLGRRPSFRSEKFEFCYVPHMLDVTSKMAFQKGVFYYWHDFPSNQRTMFGFPGWTLKQTKYLIKLKFWKQPASHTVGKNLKKKMKLLGTII